MEINIKNLRLHKKDIHPENNTAVFAINIIYKNHLWRPIYSDRYVELILFKDGKWYSLPRMYEVTEYNDFTWIEFINEK